MACKKSWPTILVVPIETTSTDWRFQVIEVVGNLWEYPADVRIITTNGTVKKNGEAVMGRGCAAQAKLLYPKLPTELGGALEAWGNRLYNFPQYSLMTFPVKHHWMQKADTELIARSVVQLMDIVMPGHMYVMPRPGCGNGRLKWADVKPLLVRLPDNVAVIDYTGGV